MNRIGSLLFFSSLMAIISFSTYGQETLQSVTDQGNSTSNRLFLWDGAVMENNNLWLKGNTMGYRDPLRVSPNLDNSGIVLEDAALRFDQAYDVFDEAGSSLLFHYPHSGIPYFRRYGTDFTILKIWSPTESRQAYESTLALVNGDNEEEFLDLYNLNYPSNSSFGIRLQKRETGNYKKFHFEYSDGNELFKVLSLAPDTTAVFYGRVGINTEANEYNLAVAGRILAESIDVKLQTNWPDYVFDEGYEKMSLQEIDIYIGANGRLPEVPSAREVSEKGVNLGEMDALLLKKVEEITLHLIEQEKRILNLEEENNKLKTLLGKQ
ncbi:hypothetical protein ACFSKL_11960 [Belliella marina]|uniref:Uncharacterized protein n=1 Tax=Belliella marina TaxID=1644146 RepID=A0ABW4VN20_9BACT